MKILLSIKPEFVQKIISGEKKVEYRKRIFKQPVDTVVVYSTMPVGKIIGEFKIENILSNSPNELWEETHEFSGINKLFFDKYFKNKDLGYAIQFNDFVEYPIPLNLSDLKQGLSAPQSFVYL